MGCVRKALRQFLPILHNLSLGVRDEQIRFCWSEVKGSMWQHVCSILVNAIGRKHRHMHVDVSVSGSKCPLNTMHRSHPRSGFSPVSLLMQFPDMMPSPSREEKLEILWPPCVKLHPLIWWRSLVTQLTVTNWHRLNAPLHISNLFLKMQLFTQFSIE